MSALRERLAQLTPQERDIMARTIVGEAANQGDVGMRAVAAVIGNRMLGSGRDAAGVVLARNQFEPWGNATARARMEALTPESPRYRQAMAQVDALARGEADPTNGATHFYAPRAQAALGRNVPRWDDGTGVDIGDHRFFRLGYGGTRPGNPHGIAPGQQAIDRQMAGGLRPASEIPGMPITAGPNDLMAAGRQNVAANPQGLPPSVAAFAPVQSPAPTPAQPAPDRAGMLRDNIAMARQIGNDGLARNYEQQLARETGGGLQAPPIAGAPNQGAAVQFVPADVNPAMAYAETPRADGQGQGMPQGGFTPSPGWVDAPPQQQAPAGQQQAPRAPGAVAFAPQQASPMQRPEPSPRPRMSADEFQREVFGGSAPRTGNEAVDFNLQQDALRRGYASWAPGLNSPNQAPTQTSPLDFLRGLLPQPSDNNSILAQILGGANVGG